MKQLDCSSTTSCWSRRGRSCPSRAGLRRVAVACFERIHLLDGRDDARTRPSRRRTCSSSGRSAAQTSARSSVRAWVATLHRRERALTAMPVERCSPCAGGVRPTYYRLGSPRMAFVCPHVEGRIGHFWACVRCPPPLVWSMECHSTRISHIPTGRTRHTGTPYQRPQG